MATVARTAELSARGVQDEICEAKLTPTQLRVLQCVHGGLANKQIAYELGIAEATVKVHMTALMRKLKVTNRTQAAIAAISLK